jgi:hypothetical protein
MRRVWIVGALLALGVGGLTPPATAEPTKYCGARIEEAEDTIKAIEGSAGRITNAQDKGEIQAWVTQAKSHIATAKAAAQEEDCVRAIELAKTLTQDALYLAAQTQ